MKLSDRIFVGVLTFIGSIALRLLKASCRFRQVDRPDFDPEGRVIFAFWHGRMLFMPYIQPPGRSTVMISRHRDGELISRIIKTYDIDSSRGSTTRGGMAALKDVLRLAKEKYNIVFTPDGPKGPRFTVQMGAIQAAKATGFPIYPVTYSARKKKLSDPGTASSSLTPSPMW